MGIIELFILFSFILFSLFSSRAQAELGGASHRAASSATATPALILDAPASISFAASPL
jgi:hypothetical protein